MDTDLRNTRARLTKLAVAAAISAVLTFFMVKAMTHSGPGPNHDPIQRSSVGVFAIFVFVVTTVLAHKLLTKKRQ
jgi:hypothetical protein